MPKSKFVDFRAVKAAITMEQVLDYYGLLEKMKRSGDNLSSCCPIHKGSNPTQFRVSVSKNVWNCFSECQHGGNTLDFIARMEDISIKAAALKAIEWFGLNPDAMSGDPAPDAEAPDATPQDREAPRPRRSEPAAPENIAPNKPLGFRLDKLEREHPYLLERGLALETVVDFGIGFCAKGMMAGRIAIPIHNPEGQVVAYAGRYPGEPAEDTPKYKLPPGFRKSLELYNLDRAIKEAPEKPLMIVEGFFACMKLHQLGQRKVVSLMGSTLSAAQEELLRKHTTAQSHIIVMLDEDEAGRAGREDIAVRLSRFAFVKVHAFAEEDMQPEQLSTEEVAAILEGVS
jgi:DNA primase